jgi:Toprim domain
MSIAATIARHLSPGACRSGSGWWNCRCPVCQSDKFGLKDEVAGLRVHCFKGCAVSEIRRELKRLGLYDPAADRVDHVGSGPLGVHLTYLNVAGLDVTKSILEPVRQTIGVVRGGAVHLGEPDPEGELIVGEGIENTLSVMQGLSLGRETEAPGWAALSASGIQSLILPPEARRVLIAADHDRPKNRNQLTGQRAAQAAARRLTAERRGVRIMLPPSPGTDWNDVLRGKAPARAKGGNLAA